MGRVVRPALLFAVIAAGASARAASVPRYHLEAVVDPAAHRIAIDGTFRDAAGKEREIHEAKIIEHGPSRQGADYARGFAETSGTIVEDGVFLSGASGWYPEFGADLFTFDLDVTLPAGWTAVSQGKREILENTDVRTRLRFVADDPQEEIWLVAGRWIETTRTFEGTQAMALLRERDDALAAKYLDATGPYLAMYGKLLGPYPYASFALVENFWETGYGMPSFTLLGSQVIRLPFILTSSYPHEILHNWWGNGVYVAPSGGNWSEGLTAYLADHLFAERTGGGAGYRQEALQKYADYAATSKDFPLASFRERHSPATEAVGYGKSLMLFHMMRRELGDETFVKGLRSLYAGFKFRRAGFDDVRKAFESASGRDLSSVFTPWVTRAGAPRLKLRDVVASPSGSAWSVSGILEQTQAGPAYTLTVPVAVTVEGRPEALQTVVRASERATRFSLAAPARPLRLDVDPEFDVFRMLDVEEAPPALSAAFGAETCTLVLPSSAEPAMLEAYRALAVDWNTGRSTPMRIVDDKDLTALPKDGSVWILGYGNRFLAPAAEALAPFGIRPEPNGDRAIAAAARRKKGQAPVIAVVAAASAAQVPGLARKLPHYHKYSHLAFDGDEPVNVEKGRFEVRDSPLTVSFAGDAPIGALAKREPLADLPPAFSKERMVETVRALAAPSMRGRKAGSVEAEAAATWIAGAMRAAGIEVLPSDPEMGNVVGVLRGTKAEWSDSSVVVGAHYDHLGVGDDAKLRPGADDNASGVAVMLELARQMAGSGAPSRTVIFVAFTGEEAGLLGSKRFVSQPSSWPAAKAIGMVNLDTVGRLFAGKVLVLGAGSADEWIHIANGAGYVTGAPVEAVMTDPGGSDQKSYADAGVPAVQLFTGANADYHGPGDTPDKIDGDGLVKVAAVAREIVSYLAERPQPLTKKGAPAGDARAGSPTGERRASLGTIPDYAFAGPGVRITGTMPGSPAESAGLQAGDVLVSLGDVSVPGLRELGDALKHISPGTKVVVTYRRDGTTRTVEVVAAAR